jgi:hypothetical protein
MKAEQDQESTQKLPKAISQGEFRVRFVGLPIAPNSRAKNSARRKPRHVLETLFAPGLSHCPSVELGKNENFQKIGFVSSHPLHQKNRPKANL